ncbi:MAG: flagellar basal body L-ring protein FlgH [Pirellulaceae bacterium]|nr:flagellar basal body L-ring protein FlgH [Pirellulaceae bacterium]
MTMLQRFGFLFSPYFIACCAMSCTMAFGQSGSLFRGPDGADDPRAQRTEQLPPPVASPNAAGLILPPSNGQWGPNHPLQAASWTAVPAQPARSLKIHDIVSIRVDEISTTTAQGNAQSRKTGLYDARLNDWIELVGIDTVKPSKQADGDPRVQGQQNEVYRASSNLLTSEQMKFNIAAEIADIRPNGTLVLSARKSVELNDNIWEASLSGVCRAQDVGPDNVILSRDIFELQVKKRDQGHVRDGYSRGWFTKWLARFKPF